jgi:hypothetical protein
MLAFDCSTEDMAGLNNDDRKWITREIQKGIEPISALQTAVEALNPRGWRKAVRLLRELGPIATLIAIVVALLGITLGALYQSVSHVKEETQFRTHTDDRLASIEKGIEEIETRLNLRDKAELKPEKFNRDLPAVAATIKSALDLGISAPEDIQDSLQQRFQQADTHAPGYWPAVAQFISYRSEQSAPTSVRSLLIAGHPPNCLGQGEVSPLDAKTMRPTSVFTWTRCVLYLDDNFGPASNLRTGDVVFKECLVIYRGGPVSDTVAIALFQDCIFAFTLDSQPARRAEMLIQFLLKALPSSAIKIPPTIKF